MSSGASYTHRPREEDTHSGLTSLSTACKALLSPEFEAVKRFSFFLLQSKVKRQKGGSVHARIYTLKTGVILNVTAVDCSSFKYNSLYRE